MDLINLKGVGPKTIGFLNKLNIFTINDLLEYYPFRYNFYNVGNLMEEENITIRGVVESEPRVYFIKRNLNRLTFRLRVNEKIINVSIFNRNFLKQHIFLRREIMLYGKYNEKKNTFTASDIKFEVFENEKIEAVYHLINGISNKDLIRLVSNLLSLEIVVEDYIPDYLNEKYNFIDKTVAVRNIHEPDDLEILKKSKLKLIYEELFLFMFKIALLKRDSKKILGVKKVVSRNYLDEFINGLPFLMTDDQIKACNDILNDLNSEKRGNRLLLGDVGSGKTIVAVASMYMNSIASFQSVLMAPTELLAIQHYFNIKDFLDKYNIVVELFVGNMRKGEKENIKKRLKNGEIDVLIGTHALLVDDVSFLNLGLVITDEQHRFGVNQRSSLFNKGISPDVLYMSATPIPRTYALTLYGDMDTSIIKEKPKGRKEIKTYVKKESDLKEVLFKVLEEIKLGHQIYVVAPVIEENDENEMHDVNELRDKFNTAFNNKVVIGVMHGKVKQNEKDAIMNDFKNNKISILISTTVIEVGIDVKNASTMIIFNAERFGLATLHQLRGRVGRGDIDSYCYLISNKETERLRVLERSNDGFYIAEEDFKLRGEGDLFGVRQSGDMFFKIANLKRDFKILMQVKDDVEDLLDNRDLNNYSKLVEISREMSLGE